MFVTAVFKMNNQQGPAIAHGTLLNVMWQPGWEGGLHTCVCVAEFLRCSPETITTLLSAIPQTK